MYKVLSIAILLGTLLTIPGQLLATNQISKSDFQTEREYLLKKLKPLIYGEWDSVNKLPDIYPSYWQRVSLESRTRMIMKLHLMEEGFRQMFEPQCGVYFEQCYPNFVKTMIYGVESNSEIIGYIVQTILSEVPGGDSEGLRMIFHKNGRLVQGPAFFTTDQIH
ncbi:MAG: hypothetical protein HN353_04465 [Bdellovibrionales bacterium]|jgi:hypothetical protein|nr:hypothetical protein [Bdellovibrionales bacterium]MBT3527461.1 hypothetical protein [Bdellovibrionales bacterium]MBT7670632.1 hypothetical protein [Bdellovibrionales bacterium]MBT7768070.1 hypothetical protein [Bdellovibrionales bacterium]